jgi:galactonate dehydratase
VKITDIRTYPIGGSRNFLFVEVLTDAGIRGLGEAGISNREPPVIAMIEQFRDFLVGEDPFRIEHIWQTLFRGGFFPASHVVSAAISAIDIALWDIKGKAFGVPVYTLLGGPVRDRVVCYPHISGGQTGDVEPLVEECLRAVEDGWKFVRLGTPATHDRDVLEPRTAVRLALRQLAAVREAVGEEIEIIFDCHTRLDLAEAVILCRESEDLHPYFVEDPLRSENPEVYGALRPRTGVPLAAGEQYGSRWEFRSVIENDWIDYARIDLCIVGGISEAIKVAGWADTHYIKLAVHNPLGPVSTAACLHLNLACTNFGVQEQPRKPGDEMQDLFPLQPTWEDGSLLPPSAPGLGLEFDPSMADRYPRRPWHDFRRMRRLDGSVTNW